MENDGITITGATTTPEKLTVSFSNDETITFSMRDMYEFLAAEGKV